MPGGREALRTSLTGHRYISGAKDGSSFVVGLELHGGPGGAVVAYSLRPELREQLGIVRTSSCSRRCSRSRSAQRSDC